jgi:hypothetical protein
VSEPVDPALLAAVEPLAKAARLDGVAMFEFRVDRRRGRHVLLEVNPRFWGSLPLAVAAGADFPALWWDLAVHGREGAGAYRAGVAKADLTGEFDRVVDRFEAAGGLARLRAARPGWPTAARLLVAPQGADSWAADDPRAVARGAARAGEAARDALRKRLPGRTPPPHPFRGFRPPDRGAGAGAAASADRGRSRQCLPKRLRRAAASAAPRRPAGGDRLGRLCSQARRPALLRDARRRRRIRSRPVRHSSNALSPRDLEQADALILLDADTEWRLRQMCPDFTAEVVTLEELRGSRYPVLPSHRRGARAPGRRGGGELPAAARPPALGDAAPPRRQAA